MEVQKVTDPNKIVTDSVLLSVLAQQDIDKDYVELFQDYVPRTLGKEHSPYAKFYKDLLSNKRFMVVSGLPMVNADGVKVQVGWTQSGKTYTSMVNQFMASVTGTKIVFTVINDQSDGRENGATLTYQPQLFLKGIEVKPKSSNPPLLSVDPINSNYANNVLEWDYGICKRRLRLIEGSILGSWVFLQKPNGEVRIKYNQIGDFKLRFGDFAVGADEEVITPEQIAILVGRFNGYPVTINDSITAYPDTTHGATTVDGNVQRSTYNATWASVRTGIGTNAYPDVDYMISGGQCDPANKWGYGYRSIMTFDTSGLPVGATVTAATLSLYSGGKRDQNNNTPTFNIYAGSPANNNTLVAADYPIALYGTTAFCDTAYTYAEWHTDGTTPNDFVFNAAGLAAVVDGISKFSFREVKYDVGTSTPTAGVLYSAFDTYPTYTADKGNGYKPKLVVTYTVGGTTATPSTVVLITVKTQSKLNLINNTSLKSLSVGKQTPFYNKGFTPPIMKLISSSQTPRTQRTNITPLLILRLNLFAPDVTKPSGGTTIIPLTIALILAEIAGNLNRVSSRPTLNLKLDTKENYLSKTFGVPLIKLNTKLFAGNLSLDIRGATRTLRIITNQNNLYKSYKAPTLGLSLIRQSSNLVRINLIPVLNLITNEQTANLQIALYIPADLALTLGLQIPNVTGGAVATIATPVEILLTLQTFAPILFSGVFPISVTGRYGVEPSASWEGILTETNRYGINPSVSNEGILTASGRYGNAR